MRSVTDYAAKLERLEAQTLLPRLRRPTRAFLRALASQYRFTFQELRQVAQAARDLEMWRETPLEAVWSAAERSVAGGRRERKKELLRRLQAHLSELAGAEKTYPDSGLAAPPRRRLRLVGRETSKRILGLCPAYSDQTVCCGLHTLDVVRGCSFGCSYCTIQTFYGETVELESYLASKLEAIELDADRSYHIGTGQSSDSLVWGNRGGTLQSLLDFAAQRPNVLLELKTKSDNINYLLDVPVPANVVCSWSLNTDTIIDNEEPGTAPLELRLRAARAVADRGIAIGFHFHPMIFYAGWSRDYGEVAARLLDRFAAHEVTFVSMGSVTLIRPVVQEIRRRGGESKILQMELVPDHHGKLTYPDGVKLKLFRKLYSSLGPWQREVLFYLCMETATMWRQVLGNAYGSNAEFEQDFLRRCLPPPTSSLLETLT
jgi:spore photoproduct lyase